MLWKNESKKIIILICLMLVNQVFANDVLDLLIKDYYNEKNENLYNKNGNKKTIDSNFVINRGKSNLKISNSELMEIAEKIYRNETGGKRENLVAWNSGENFPSLGVGHFIWAKSSDSNGIFGESLPGLVQFYKEKGVELPKLLSENRFAPWKNRAELIEKKSNGDAEIEELINFFDNTRDIQILYIFNRLEDSLEKMVKASENGENIKMQFYRVANSKNGLYALIDYVNFKGEGLATSSLYNNQGWGLRQVLENMHGTSNGESAVSEFAESAKEILTNRVLNAPRNETQWLIGWHNRLDTYKK